MFRALPLVLSAFVASTYATYNCTTMKVPVSVSLETTKLDLSAPANETELTALVTQIVSATSNVTSALVKGTELLNATYEIYSQLCIPAGFKQNGTLEFAIHGINFDHSYWTFGGKGSPYNYVEAAINAGHAIFIYDRLGVGHSTKPDGIKEVQLSTEIAVAESLVKHVRKGIDGHTFGKVVGIGHSFGSIQLVGLAAKHGNVVDATVLTGFSTYSGSTQATFAGFGVRFAAQQNAKRWGNLTNSYLATQGIYNDQLTFFHYPEFDFANLELAETTKATLTIGELLTQGEALASPATSYTGPVFVVTGDKDFIFCGANCYQSMNGSANLLEPSKALFPAASSFSTYIPVGTGHAVNQHFSAPETYRVIEKWIGA
ncbi:hypothetical protein PLICRDRAFT_123246 [Plicaturopsis crispa FD-325 SS-3]|nr:hypothetical protein PLICRDRAFT_123246 [Plicaturopsis crispa FD-325 SS-3]